ncbi:alanine racemase [Thalassobacillus hwangdonensis]|uniref:Alanine racemase n=1 Tax=Thalassobacillus hwangdonensis TaxID=546108 RepID=A0ABW3L084_9BACI
MQTFYRDSWVEVRLDAIEYNINQLKQHIGKDKKIYAVVKADAYGHGDTQVAKAALDAGAAALAVSLLDEAIRLRECGFTCPILVMGWVRPQDASIAAEMDISLTFFQEDWIKEVKNLDLANPLKLHMKWDTGMGRLGIRSVEEMQVLLKEVQEDERLILEGIFTHFATADDSDAAYYQEQQKRLGEMLTEFKALWQDQVNVHTSNSAASLRYPGNEEDFVRFGISMYGLYPSPVVKGERQIELQPAFSLHSRIVHVKKLKEGECVSYGATYCATEDTWIATVPLGYADGWIRRLQGIDVLVDGKRRPIVGRICMDQFMIELDKEYDVGEQVTLIGRQGDEEITADEVAAYLDTINYEIPCMISERVPRVYKSNQHIVDIENSLSTNSRKMM